MFAVEPDQTWICGVRRDAGIVTPAIAAAAVQPDIMRDAGLQQATGLECTEGICRAASCKQYGSKLARPGSAEDHGHVAVVVGAWRRIEIVEICGAIDALLNDGRDRGSNLAPLDRRSIETAAPIVCGGECSPNRV